MTGRIVHSLKLEQQTATWTLYFRVTALITTAPARVPSFLISSTNWLFFYTGSSESVESVFVSLLCKCSSFSRCASSSRRSCNQLDGNSCWKFSLCGFVKITVRMTALSFVHRSRMEEQRNAARTSILVEENSAMVLGDDVEVLREGTISPVICRTGRSQFVSRLYEGAARTVAIRLACSSLDGIRDPIRA